MDMFNAGTQDVPRVELGRRHFTVEQANRALVLVGRIIADVLDAYQRVRKNMPNFKALYSV